MVALVELGVVVFIIAVLAASSIRVLREYERAVVFMLADLNESMVRAIARQAEAERERRAKVIHAEGELQASEKLLQAAQMLAQAPQAMQLRYLQTLTQLAGDRTSTIVFPVPLE